MNILNEEQIEELRKEAMIKYKENENKKLKIKEIKELEFLKGLKEISENFVSMILQKTMNELKYCSLHGILTKKFYVDHFKNKKGNVKVSTLVKGFKIKEEWNDEIFKKIGYESTPFQYVVSILKERNILLEDISDINKGLSFWCQVSFLNKE